MTIEDAIQQFNQLPLEIQLECSSEEFLSTLHALETKYGHSLSAVAVNIIVGNFQFSNLAESLEHELSLEKGPATSLAQDLKQKVFDPVLERLRFLNTSSEKDMTLEQEKNFAENLFKTNVLKELHHDPFIISALNDRLFYILARDEQFNDRLARALYENNEKVTEHPIQVNKDQVSPTIGNWIKDYISHYGSQTYDSLSQSKFITSSENTKNLTPQEKELVHDILKVYINIAFFPDSMPSDDGEGWEIITGGLVEEVTYEDSEKEVVSKPEIKSQSPLQPIPVVSKPITPIKKEQPVVKSVQKPAVENKTPSTHSSLPSPEILNLRNMLLQYPPNSLERQAIEEEIKKLEKK
mgnify:CR=1 FL=1